MISLRRLEANRGNALRSTGPKTENGKHRSRANAVRHVLTAETVVGSLEDAEDYKAFEATIVADYDAETAVARELVLRLASLLWRLRRAVGIETDLLEIQAEVLQERFDVPSSQKQGLRSVNCLRSESTVSAGEVKLAVNDSWFDGGERAVDESQSDSVGRAAGNRAGATRRLTDCFIRLANLDNGVFERLNRYEAALWRQTVQTLIALHPIRQR